MKKKRLFPMKQREILTIKEISARGVNPAKPFNLAKNRVWQAFKTPKNDNIPFHRKTFFNELLYECGDFEAYTDSLEVFTTNLENWSVNRLHYWQRMYDILCVEYEPLWNYNRFDDDKTNTDRNTDTTSNDEAETKNAVAGYDSGQLVANYDTKSTLDEELKEKLLQDWTRNNHSYGNIGVMSTQDLIKQELEICTYSMYNIMLDEFKQKFCILIY